MKLVLPFLTVAGSSDNWPRFRGPDAMGVAEDPRLPDTWSATENVTWKAEVPGRGWSFPIVWKDRMFLTSVVSDEHGAAKMGFYSGGPQDIPGGEHRWMVYGLDWDTGAIPCPPCIGFPSLRPCVPGALAFVPVH